MMARTILFFILCCMWPSVRGALRAGTVRLWNNGVTSSSLTSGRVQFFFSSSSGWNGICRLRSFHSNVSDVICHQLGYTGSSSWSYAANDSYGTDARSLFNINDVSCSNSQYLTFFQCSFDVRYNPQCSNSENVGVSCYTTRIWDNPYNGQIRLTGGSYSNEGLLEIYCNGRWGTVCDDSFGSIDADTACKQLGYTASISHFITLSKNSSQPGWLNDVSCTSSDTCLTSCQGCPSEDYNCGRSRDILMSCGSIFSSSNTNTVGSCLSSSVGGIVAGSIIGGLVLVMVLVIVITAVIAYLYKRHTWHRTTATTTPPPSTLMPQTNQAAPPAYNANNVPPPYNPSLPSQPVAYPPTTQYITHIGFGEVDSSTAGGFTSEEPPAYDPNWMQPTTAPHSSIYQY